MPPAHIQLLGGFSMRTSELGLPSLTRARQQSFLAYLLLHCHQPHPRQTIAATFWPESSDVQASKNLRVLLVELRQVWNRLDDYVEIERSTLRWLPNTMLLVDVIEFEQACHAVKSAFHSQTSDQKLSYLYQAVTHYTGDFLPHFYEDWIQRERSRLSNQFKDALSQLAHLQHARGCFAEAIQAAQRLQQYDPLSERACRLFLECYPQQGETTRALQAYQNYESALWDELGVEPEAELKARYLELLRQQSQPKTSQPTSPPPKTEPAPTLVGRTNEWQQLTLLWRNAHSQASHFVLLTGEAGIGKTQLAEQFLRWVQLQGASVAAVKCYTCSMACAVHDSSLVSQALTVETL